MSDHAAAREARYDLVLRDGTCVLPWGEERTNIGVRDGVIAALGVPTHAPAAATLDLSGLHVLPGLIDAHVHLRDPGDPAIESISTGTRAALLGGICTVFDMPNTSPPATDIAALAAKRAVIERDSHADFACYVGATRANTPDLAALETEPGICAVKVFAGSSTGDLMIEDDPGIEAVLRSGRRRVCFHSEDEYRLRERRPLFSSGMPYDTHRVWRDEEAAFLGTRRIVALAERTGRPIHILHVSTAEELHYLRAHRATSTVEVLVNHLTQFAPDCYDRLGGLAVMNPPIRDRRHHDASWAAIADGTVDVVSSDHAPHPLAAKQRPWPDCPAGLTGVQTIVPLMLDHVSAGRLSLSRLADLMAAGPARIYGVPTKGRLAAGFDADFTIVDMKHEREITNDWIATPCGWTPFHGTVVRGWPVMTVLRGRIAMRDDAIQGPPSGRLVRFAA